MSVVGIDVGNQSCIVTVARQRDIDVVLNDESKRETPAVVYFGDKQRFIGTAGASWALTNPKNTVSQIKRLIGKLYSDPEMQRDLEILPFDVTEGNDGTPLIHARYLGESRTFTPTQILAMILSNLKQIAKDNLKTEIVDCCIGILVYFTDLERRAVSDAASIVNLNPLCLLHETTAIALAYGIYKTDLPETDCLNVLFVDIGHASMQVCIAAFKKGELKVLANAFDRSLGGRDFDEVLFRYFSWLFKNQYQIDVPTNARASQRLRAACEKLKKVLSTNCEARLNIECLMDEKDVRGFIRRDEFEQLSLPILERVKGPCERALFDARLTVDKIHAVEVVGSGSQVPSILRILTEFFGKEPRRTMNASECVARGCALQCAILSPAFIVRDFKIQESFPFSIALSWRGFTPEVENRAADQLQHFVVFPKGNTVPCRKVVTIFRRGTFVLDFLYADHNQVQVQRISSYTIGPFQTPNGERAKIKLKVQMDKNGFVSVTSAILMIEEEEVELPVALAKENAKEEKGAVAMETDAGQSNGVSGADESVDVNMQEYKNAAEQASTGATSENGASELDDKTAQMKTDAKVKVVKKGETMKTELPITEIIFGGLPRAELKKAAEEEFEMALQDRIMEENKEKKNMVEAYVYDMRNKSLLAQANDAKDEGNRLFGAGENEGALMQYANALEIAPDHPMANEIRSFCYTNRGICYYRLKKYEETIKESTKALDINPAYMGALIIRAEAHEKLELFEEAIADMKKVLELDGSNEQARRAIIRLEALAAEKCQKLKEEMIGKFKEQANSVLGRFGLNVDNFKAVKDPNTESYSISFQF